MSTAVKQQSPKAVWHHFAALNAVPRPSKKEERVIAFMMDFGKRLGLDTCKDSVGNVIIRKPASQDMVGCKVITLQSHLDMVHQKNADTVFNFDEQGIDMYVDGDWVKAKGTTLGADNGLGVATIMALLESTDIPHPPLEALFTIDEETGMTGAMGLEAEVLQGEILLNLDTEEDDELDIGCAGGIDVTAKGLYSAKPVAKQVKALKLTVKGLKGGHSGIEIHKGLGNANKILARLLHKAYTLYAIQLSSMDGGSLRNAIPREAFSVFTVQDTKVEAIKADLKQWSSEIAQELAFVDADVRFEVEEVVIPSTVMLDEDTEKLLKVLYVAHNGVFSMSAAMDNLVETSNNVARVAVAEGKIHIGCLTRSSVETGKMNLAEQLKATFSLAGYDVSFSGAYPGWNPNPNSEILELAKSKYISLFNEEPKVVACHAGLECGILGKNYPNMDMISFGPTILGAHSPDERVSISSVQKFWRFLLAILKDCPKA